jgi:hypothetical protein
MTKIRNDNEASALASNEPLTISLFSATEA